ncbi:41118_t:CDS:2, partial [Gigaspora margarita]
ANARYLSDEVIKDIKTSFGRVPDAINTMAKKYRPLGTTFQVINNQLEDRPKEKDLKVSDLSTISDTKLEQVLNE